MPFEPTVLAHHQDFGSVYRCPHGCYHVQVGAATIALSDRQYQRFVAMINDSAANHELLRDLATEGERDSLDAHEFPLPPGEADTHETSN